MRVRRMGRVVLFTQGPRRGGKGRVRRNELLGEGRPRVRDAACLLREEGKEEEEEGKVEVEGETV